LSAVAPLLKATALPALRVLRLSGSGGEVHLQVPILKALLDSRLLLQLHGLSLKMSALDEEGARVVLENAAKLSHLKALSIEDDCEVIGAGVREALEKTFAAQMKAFAKLEAAGE